MKHNLKSLPPIEKIEDEVVYAQVLAKCSNSCSYFAEQFLGLEVFDYNKVFLDCEERFIVYRTGRQVGKSRNAAIKAIHFGYYAPLKASNLDEGECNVVIASISKDQAFLIFRKISNFIHKSPTLSKKIRYETKSELQLEWFDGSGVTNFIVRPIGDTGDSLRGFTVHFAILDEAAYIPQVVYDAFIPSTVTTRPRILLTSTPKGKFGAFFNACETSYVLFEKGVPRVLQNKDRKYKWVQFHVTTFDNPLAASDPEITDMIKATTKAAERQELYGEFLEGGNSIVSYNLLQESLIPLKERPKFAYYELGVDTSGKGKDETVLITMGITEDGRIFPVDVYVELTTDQTKLAVKIQQLHVIYKYRRIYMDSTGIGDTLVDNCRAVDPTLPVYGINFKQEKTELYVNLERIFEARLINLTLLEDFYKDKLSEQISYMYWEHGKYHDQQSKVRTEHPDDFSDSCALGCYGQQKGDFMQELPPEFWSEGYGNNSLSDETSDW